MELLEPFAALRGKRNDPSAAVPPPSLKRIPIVVLDQIGARQIIHSGAFEVLVGEDEAGGMDDMDRHAEAGAEAHDRAGVLRDVRLEKGAVDH